MKYVQLFSERIKLSVDNNSVDSSDMSSFILSFKYLHIFELWKARKILGLISLKKVGDFWLFNLF